MFNELRKDIRCCSYLQFRTQLNLIFFNFFSFIITQNKFQEIPVVLVTAEHLRTGKEYDASLIWKEDTNKDSFQVCLREMQNFDGKHEDINVVCSS